MVQIGGVDGLMTIARFYHEILEKIAAWSKIFRDRHHPPKAPLVMKDIRQWTRRSLF